MLLAISREKFLRICDKFPDSKRVLVEKAQKRRKQFKINKTKSLVKLMKVLVNNFECGFKKIASLDENYLEKQTKIIEMYKMLVSHYKLTAVRKELMIKDKERQKRL